jgi:RNA processing factor Prp31
MRKSEINNLIDALKPAIRPKRIELLKNYFKDHGDIGYLWQFRTQAVVGYFETGRPEAYWDNMRRVGELQIELFKRFEAGERISSDYVSDSMANRVVDCISGGNFDLIPTFAKLMHKVKEEKNFYNFKLLRHLFSNTNASEDIKKATAYAKKQRKWDIAFNDAIVSLIDRNIDDFNSALERMMKLYKGIYKYEVPEFKLIAIDALFFIQLARHYGMDVQIQHELIPQDLIKPVEHSQ